MKIYKYPLEIQGEQEVTLHENFEILHLGEQNGYPTIWVKVNPYAPQVVKRLRCIGTGQPFEDTNLAFVGTVQISPFVWHFYIEQD